MSTTIFQLTAILKLNLSATKITQIHTLTVVTLNFPAKHQKLRNLQPQKYWPGDKLQWPQPHLTLKIQNRQTLL